MGEMRRRLLNTTGPVKAVMPAMNLTTATTPTPQPPAEILAHLRQAVDALGPKPRWAGDRMPGIEIEADPNMPPGWFGLREPGAIMPYAGPLPMASFAAFYRGGKIVRVSPAMMAEIKARARATTRTGETGESV